MNYKELYEDRKMSIPQIVKMMEDQGIKTSVGYVYNRLKESGASLRTSSEAARLNSDGLDYNVSFLTEEAISWIDGFLLGDGNINPAKTQEIKVARAQVSLQYKEFCDYMISGFESYKPCESEFHVDTGGKSEGCWHSRTRFHPDLYAQYMRWYPDGKKIVPNDVRLDKTSVMLWYLGDGTVIQDSVPNTTVVRLSTDSFPKENVEWLAGKLCQMGIRSHRNNDNRIYVEAKGLPAFFNLIGTKSPVDCYKYKFDQVPEWRFSSKRMKETAEELGVSYNRLSHLVKIGKAPCFRASEKGKPRFLPEHMDALKELIEIGDLY